MADPTQIANAGDQARLPEFDNPPINEVVCGVQFRSLERLLVPHIGLLWEQYIGDFPVVQEVPPLLPVIEPLEGEAMTIPKPQFVELPPMPRVWMVSSGGNEIIQLQRDRFLYNWRKVNRTDAYPRYGQVVGAMRGHLRTFQKFLAERDLGSLDPVQYEMTYVNHIYEGEGWTKETGLGNVFPDFGWRNEKRFLPNTEAVNWSSSFRLPENSGRMHVTIRNAETLDKRNLILFEIMVRGMALGKSGNEMQFWFDQARKWIVEGFADLTATDVQKNIWRRTR